LTAATAELRSATGSPVGASLLAMAVGQSIKMLDVMASSRASPPTVDRGDR